MHKPSLEAFLFMALGVFAFSIVDASTKGLAGGYGTWQIIVITRVIPLLTALTLALRQQGGLASLRTPYVKTHAVRSLLVIVTTYCFYESLRTLPLVDAITISFAGPIFITAMSGPVLGEKVGLRRWFAVLFGFAGVLIALRPGAHFNMGALFALMAALAYSTLQMWLRPLSGKESTHNILFYSTLLTCIAALPLSLGQWRNPSFPDLCLFALQGSSSMIAQLCMIRALRSGEASMLAPLEYTALVWGTILGFIFWNELPTLQVFIGAVFIIAANLYAARKETATVSLPASEQI